MKSVGNRIDGFLILGLERAKEEDIGLPLEIELRGEMALPGRIITAILISVLVCIILFWIRMPEEAGSSLLAVHGRTRDRKGDLTGIASWQVIKAIKEGVSIPIFANGNILSYEDIQKCLDYTGVEGIMSAEGILHNPALFTGSNPYVWQMVEEYLDLAKYHNTRLKHVRTHLFRLMQHSLEEYPILQNELAVSHDFIEFRDVSNKMKENLLSRITLCTNENIESVGKLLNSIDFNDKNNFNQINDKDCKLLISDDDDKEYFQKRNRDYDVPIWLCHSWTRVVTDSKGNSCYRKRIELGRNEDVDCESQNNVSKNVERKIRRHKRIIEAKKPRRKRKKECRIEKLAELRKAGIVAHVIQRKNRNLARKRMRKVIGHAPRICIDLSFGSMMSEKELHRLTSQLRCLYGSNQNSIKPVHLYFTSFGEENLLYKVCCDKNDCFLGYVETIKGCHYCKALLCVFSNFRPHFLCKLCGIQIKLRTTMRSSRYPSGRKNECRICHKVFLFKSLLRRHIKSHTKGRLFKCNICNKSYKYKSSLKRHEKKKHPKSRTQSLSQAGINKNIYQENERNPSEIVNGTRREQPAQRINKVRPATNWIEDNECYNMQLNPHGTCVILNNYYFNNNEANRYGSHEDIRMLKITFDHLKYKVLIYENKTANEIKKIFENISKNRHNYIEDSFVCIIMSHGNQGVIYGTCGGEIFLENIFELFNNKNCLALLAKPKMFFIQSCRGEKSDFGIPIWNIVSDSHHYFLHQRDSLQIPTWSDIIVTYCTINGYKSYRSPVYGSWFIQHLTRVLLTRGHNTDLLCMLYQVTREMNKSDMINGRVQTIQIDLRGIRNKIYFNAEKIIL